MAIPAALFKAGVFSLGRPPALSWCGFLVIVSIVSTRNTKTAREKQRPMIEHQIEIPTRDGANAEVEIYPGSHHGFAFPKRPVYHRDAAERHWERLLALYRRNL
jgi:dienelactone hydrolase